MPFLSTNNISLHYLHLHPEKSSTKAPLLLLAGMASDSASWQPIINSLRKNYELIIPDNRCTGQTTPSPVDTHREAMVADTLALLDSLGIEKFNILGHSMGGMLAWALAASAPSRVDKLIAAAALPSVIPARIALFESLSALREDSSEQHWFKLLYQFLFHPDFFKQTAIVEAAVAASVQYPYKQSAAAFDAQVRGLRSFLNPPDINVIISDITLITGSHDILTTPAMIEKFASENPALTTYIVNNAAHALHWEQTTDFVNCVIKALEE